MGTGIYLTTSLLICGLLIYNKKTRINYSLVILYALLLIGFCVYSFINKGVTELYYFLPDSLGLLMLASLAIVTVPALWHGYRYIVTRSEETPRSRGLFFGAMILLITACSMAFISNHIAVNWIFVEITTLSASVLIYHHRNIRALEGVWKYVFLCAISITFIYVGILFLSLSLKQAGIDSMTFQSLYDHSAQLNPFWLKLAFLFIFTGFTVKLGLVPMYTAGIDAKDKAPAPAAALLASVLMNVGFVGVYRVYAIMAHSELLGWANTVILFAAILTIFVAAVYMTRIKNFKRILAYSGIEHMGLVMLGLAAGGIGVYAAILHIVLHTFVKPGLFFQYSMIYRVYESKSVYDMGNYFKYYKTGAIVILLGFISATAMPPSGLFVSELMIFQALFEGHHFAILLAVLILLTIIIWGFGTNVFKLLFTPPVKIDESRIPKISPWESFSQYVLLILAMWLAYAPPYEFISMIEESVKLIH